MFIGHAVTYVFVCRTMTDGHGHFASQLESVIATMVLSCVVLVARAMRARGHRLVCETPSLPVLGMLPTTLQVVGVAAALIAFLERYAITIAIMYLRRTRSNNSYALRWPVAAIQMSLQVATRVGFHGVRLQSSVKAALHTPARRSAALAW